MLKQYQIPIFITIIALTALFIYFPILKNEFVYDDYFTIVGNPIIQTNNNPIRYFTNPVAYYNYLGYNHNYRPIGAWLFSIEFSYFQYNPEYYHALSIILHALNTIILFFIFSHFFKRAAFAFLGSLIFLIHPVQTEAVNWATEQTLLWGTMLILLTILLIIKRGEIPKRIYYLYIPLALLSVLTKDQFVILPILVTAVLWFLKADFKKYFAEIAVTSSATAIYIILRAVFIGSFVTQQEAWGGGIYPTILTMSNVFAKYLSLIIKGFPLTVNYDDFPVTTGLSLHTLLSVLIVIAFMAALIIFKKRTPLVSLGIAWFFITLLTVTNFPFPLNSLMNERFLYPALPGIIITVFSLVMLIKKRIDILKPDLLWKSGFLPFRPSSLILTTLFVSLMIYYGAITRNRLFEWRDEEALWNSALKLSPNVRNWTNYIRALSINGKDEEAAKVTIDGNAQYGNFGYYVDDIKSRANLYPDVPKVNDVKDTQAVRLAIIYSRMKKFAEAEAVLKPRLRIINNGNSRGVAITLSDIYLATKDYDKSINILRNIQKGLRPDDEILFKFALAEFLKNGTMDNLERLSGLLKNQGLKKMLPNLLLAYKEKEAGNWKNVSLLLIPALTSNPMAVLIEPYLWLGEAEIAQGKFESAIQVHREIMRIDPSSTDARRMLKKIEELQKNQKKQSY